MLVRTSTGADVVVRASVTFLTPLTANGAETRTEPIDPRDKIILPDGTTGPIVNISGPVDPDTGAPFLFEVLLG